MSIIDAPTKGMMKRNDAQLEMADEKCGSVDGKEGEDGACLPFCSLGALGPDLQSVGNFLARGFRGSRRSQMNNCLLSRNKQTKRSSSTTWMIAD